MKLIPSPVNSNSNNVDTINNTKEFNIYIRIALLSSLLSRGGNICLDNI